MSLQMFSMMQLRHNAQQKITNLKKCHRSPETSGLASAWCSRYVQAAGCTRTQMTLKKCSNFLQLLVPTQKILRHGRM